MFIIKMKGVEPVKTCLKCEIVFYILFLKP